MRMRDIFKHSSLTRVKKKNMVPKLSQGPRDLSNRYTVGSRLSELVGTGGCSDN